MANTQTAVPLFVANAILTAAQQNISAGTGVPVFATTVTRDAAFGGSNKALAEGQLCYLESTDVVQYYTGAAWATVGPTGTKLGQVVQATSATSTSTTSSSYVTTTLAVTITPTLNTSKVLIMAATQGTNSVGTQDAYYTLFRGTVAGTDLGSASVGFTDLFTPAGRISATVALNFLDSPATTSATTYTVGMKGSGSAVRAQEGGTLGTIIAIEVLV